MPLSRKQVEHVATLARLRLTPEETDSLTRELGAILSHVDQLAALNTENVQPTEFLAVPHLPLRHDEATPGVTHEAALAPAPSVLSEGFRVPAFVDD